jgi:hypothetical protein
MSCQVMLCNALLCSALLSDHQFENSGRLTRVWEAIALKLGMHAAIPRSLHGTRTGAASHPHLLTRSQATVCAAFAAPPGVHACPACMCSVIIQSRLQCSNAYPLPSLILPQKTAQQGEQATGRVVIVLCCTSHPIMFTYCVSATVMRIS